MGLEIWRIEQFEVKHWPAEHYGCFYEKDSYIILQTYEAPEVDGIKPDKLCHRIFFWLGLHTAIDEMGTAAYKTVELDDLFDGACRHHREVMTQETDAFKALFPSGITYWEGGVASGFRKVWDVDLDTYMARLLHVKKGANAARQATTVVVEVPCKRGSLNHGDCFILDTGATLYVWCGKQSSAVERAFAKMAADELEHARAGQASVAREIDAGFWEALGGEGPVRSKEDAKGDAPPKALTLGEGALYKLSDGTGRLTFDEVHRGALDLSMLLPDDVFLCDPGTEIIVWVGEHASDRERRAAMLTATKYLALRGKPHTTPIKVFKTTDDAMNDATFAQVFAGC